MKKKKALSPVRQVEKLIGCDPLGIPRNAKECIVYNTTVFHRTLLKMKATKVVISYSGGGDQGQVENVEVYVGKKALDEAAVSAVEVEYYTIHGSWTPTGSTSAVSKKTATLHDAFEDLADDLIDAAGRGGYGNNEGGQGTVTFNVKDKKIDLAHEDNGESESCSDCNGSGTVKGGEESDGECEKECETCGGGGSSNAEVKVYPHNQSWKVKPYPAGYEDEDEAE